MPFNATRCSNAGLAARARLPDGVSDICVARALLEFGLGPASL